MGTELPKLLCARLRGVTTMGDAAVEAHDVAQLRALVCELAVKLEQQKVRKQHPHTGISDVRL